MRSVSRVLAIFLACASPVLADNVAYRFKAGEPVVYEVKVTEDVAGKVKATIGYLKFRPLRIEPNGQIVLRHNYAVVMTTETEEGRTVRYGNGQPPAFVGGSANGDDAAGQHEFTVDANGTVIAEEGAGEPQLPSLLGHVWRHLMPVLPAAGQSSWITQRSLTTYIEQTEKQNRGFSPFGRERTTRIERQAQETVNYSLAEAVGGMPSIKRNYDLVSNVKVNDKPTDHVTGDGTYVFDPAVGLVRTYNASYSYEVNGQNVTMKIPLSVKARLIESDELTKLSKAAEVEEVRQSEANATFRTERANNPSKLPEGIIKTASVGSNGGSAFIKIDAEQRRPVIGLRIEIGGWGGKKVLRICEPLYEKPDDSPEAADFKNKDGDKIDVLAKEGYAVGGAFLSGPDYGRAIRIIFMKKTAKGLDTKQSYVSPWYGELIGTARTRVGGDGKFVAGTFGQKGLNLDRLGLLMYDPKAGPAGGTGDPTDDPNFGATPTTKP